MSDKFELAQFLLCCETNGIWLDSCALLSVLLWANHFHSVFVCLCKTPLLSTCFELLESVSQYKVFSEASTSPGVLGYETALSLLRYMQPALLGRLGIFPRVLLVKSAARQYLNSTCSSQNARKGSFEYTGHSKQALGLRGKYYSGNLHGVSITGDTSNCSQSECGFGDRFSHQNRVLISNNRSKLNGSL